MSPYADPPAPPSTCECDAEWHGPGGCRHRPADHGDVISSPALCMGCLYGCAGDMGL